MVYDNRQAAGVKLAGALQAYYEADTVIVALPRGGVVLGYEVAISLHVPLDVSMVYKIGHPLHGEYAIGAIAEDQAPIYNPDEVAASDAQSLKEAEVAARDVIRQRRALYVTPDITRVGLKGKSVILVDDGMATGFTMQAAVAAMIAHAPKRITVAVPVASSESIARLRPLVDEVIVLDNPLGFMGTIGDHYRAFNQVHDNQVNDYLRRAQQSYRAYVAELELLRHEEMVNPKEVPRNPQS